MSEVILHVGMHKTGSSSIQQSFAHRLPDANLRYAHLGSPNHSIRLRSAFSSSPEADIAIFQRPGWTPDGILAYCRESRLLVDRALVDDGASKLVFSGEGVTSIDEPGLVALRDCLRANGRHSVRVVAYVREPTSYVASIFQQNLKVGVAELPPEPPGYRDRFEKMERVFGRDSVEYWLYEPEAFPERCVVRDFARRVGTEMGVDDLVRANDGLSRRAVGLLWAFRKHRPRAGVIADAVLVAHLARLTGPSLRFGPAVTEPILAANRDDIAWMEARLGRPFVAEAASAAADVIQSEADLERYDDASLEWLARQLGGDAASTPSIPADPEAVALAVDRLVQRLLQDGAVTIRHDAATLLMSMMQDGTTLPSKMTSAQMSEVLEREVSNTRHERIARVARTMERAYLERLRQILVEEESDQNADSPKR